LLQPSKNNESEHQNFSAEKRKEKRKMNFIAIRGCGCLYQPANADLLIITAIVLQNRHGISFAIWQRLGCWQSTQEKSIFVGFNYVVAFKDSLRCALSKLPKNLLSNYYAKRRNILQLMMLTH
jgi:hypothetical protein